ncbi:NAD(P)H-hydrate epimerase [Peptoniphilus stercorisuis]|uniref:NAD(P)H-hydrate epimerase n=1 Tax=Peptoniphilus stercorisuis TaxID=1436965 RepID=A0ABS4K9Q4_9FIRM|nr:NAD(P)H-hydrate epimerase [Peptoniphilus stercorisuis]MBP2024502.1 NAD(P)H-hydrate epimerase [Peptoniphilus stercorisuis]
MSISREEMIELDRNAIENYGIRSIVLMENAAMGVFNEVKDYNSFTIICGSGNNGGDGLALGRHLLLNKKDVDIFIIEGRQSNEFTENLEILKKLTKNIYYINKKEDLDNLVNSLEINEISIDCIFGTGLSRNISGIYKDVINCINQHSNYTIAIDIPSGLDANSGDILGIMVKSDETITIHDIKHGLLKNDFVGKIKEVYVGIPKI